MTGFDLRAQIEAFDDVLTDVGEFLKEMGVPDTEELVKKARENLEDLFYLIPLEKEDKWT